MFFFSDSAPRARLLLASWSLALVVHGMACGGSDNDNAPSATGDDEDDEEVATPSVIAVSPTTWHAGDTIKVTGSNFIGQNKGRVMLRFVGTFESESGGSEEVDMEVEATPYQSNRADFVFQVDVAPSGFGADVGTFTGKMSATNINNRGLQAKSATTATTIDVGPSIIVWSMGPSNISCADRVISNVLNGDLVELDLEVTGVGSGSSYAPIQLTIAYVDATDNPTVVEDSITDGTSTYVTIDPGSLVEGDNDEAITDARTSRDISLSITATDGDGETLSRLVTFTLRQEMDVYYDGNSRITEVFEPQAVTGCLPGGQTGTSFNYSEGTSESRSRSVGLSGSFGVDLWILNVGFGFSVSSGVSSGTSTGLGASHSVFPHWNGAFFRQTSKLRRTGIIYRYDSCGDREEVGEAVVTDWTWAPGFNQKKETCPPLPEPLLSEAGILEFSGD